MVSRARELTLITGFAEHPGCLCEAFILALYDFCHAFRWYHSPDQLRRRIPAEPLSKEGAMTERNLTEREDRLVIFWLTAMAIVLVFVFILSGP
jgi:hypothetical protein